MVVIVFPTVQAVWSPGKTVIQAKLFTALPCLWGALSCGLSLRSECVGAWSVWNCSAFVIRTLLMPAACSPLADFAPVPPKLGHSDTFSLHCPPRESDQDSYDLILCYWPVSSSLTCINLQMMNTLSNGGVTIKYLCATVFLLKQNPPRKLKMLD